jgi:hypothetical protein
MAGVWSYLGGVVVQAVRRHLLNAETPVRSRVGLCGIYGRESSSGTDFSSVFPCRNSTMALHVHTSCGG